MRRGVDAPAAAAEPPTGQERGRTGSSAIMSLSRGICSARTGEADAAHTGSVHRAVCRPEGVLEQVPEGEHLGRSRPMWGAGAMGPVPDRGSSGKALSTGASPHTLRGGLGSLTGPAPSTRPANIPVHRHCALAEHQVQACQSYVMDQPIPETRGVLGIRIAMPGSPHDGHVSSVGKSSSSSVASAAGSGSPNLSHRKRVWQ